MAKAMTLEDIQLLTEQFADARNEMMAAGDAMNMEMEAVKQAFVPALKTHAHDATRTMKTLYDAINANQHLFAIKGQKTKVFAGIKVGLNSGKAKVVSALSAKDLYEKALTVGTVDPDTIVKVEYELRQSALNALSDELLPALKLTRKPAEDSPIVKPIDEAAAKIVDGLIKEFVADDE